MNLLVELLTGNLKFELQKNETELYSDGANLFRGGIAIGGKLILTSNRLIFLPHNLNFDRKEEYIALTEIDSMKMARTMGLIDNGLRITLMNETELKFVLNDREKWIEMLNKVDSDIALS